MLREIVTFLRDWRFVASAGISLSLGVSASVVVFALVDPLWFRPLAIAGADRTVVVHVPIGAQTAEGEELSSVRLGLADQLRHIPEFEAVVLEATDWQLQPDIRPMLVMPEHGGELTVAAVSAGYFSDLGLDVTGPGFRPDDASSGMPIGVISEDLYRRLGGTEEIIGSRVRSTGGGLIVAGVAPRGFRGVRYGTHIDVWIPLGSLAAFGGAEGFTAGFVPVAVYARLQPGVDIRQAEAAVRSTGIETGVLRPLREVAYPVRSTASAARQNGLLWMLLCASAAVLLVGCANLASLWLAKTSAERNENILRIALGCGPQAMASRLMIHVGALAAGSAVVGLMCGAAALQIVTTQILPGGVSVQDINPAIDWRIVLASASAALVATAIAASGPLYDSTRLTLAGIMSGHSSGVAERSLRTHQWLVAAHAALTMTLLVVAMHLSAVVWMAEYGPRGFSGDSAVYIKMRPRPDITGSEGRLVVNYQMLLERLRRMDEVSEADFGVPLVAMGQPPVASVMVGGATFRFPILAIQGGPRYATAVGMRLVAGRMLVATDAVQSPEPVVVDAALAERLWPGSDAVGKTFQVEQRPLQVVGVLGALFAERQLSAPTFLALGARFGEAQVVSSSAVSIAVGVTPGSDPPIGAIQDAVREIFGDLSVLTVSTGTAIIRRELAGERLGAVMFVGFSLAAGLLAITGVYGLGVLGLQRTRRETGIRLALGAPPLSITTNQLKITLIPVIAGILIGGAFSVGLARLLAHSIPGYGTVKLGTYLACLLVYAVALSAAIVPILRRARSIRPAEILRVGN